VNPQAGCLRYLRSARILRAGFGGILPPVTNSMSNQPTSS